MTSSSARAGDSEGATPQQAASPGSNNVVRGMLSGLIPLGLLLVLVIITLLLAALARQLLSASGFFAQQQAAVIILAAGLIVTIIVYAIACVRALRRVAKWQQAGLAAQSRAALFALAFTALVVLLPILLALLLPQHPAP
jgi:hypothetical protein